MTVTKHCVHSFRNLEDKEIIPDREMNIIFGENGKGKTNLIESIWLMTGFYSFRSRKNSQLIMDTKHEATIETDFFSFDREQHAKMTIGQKKELELNYVPESSPRAMMGRFPAVVFSPGTLALVQSGPGERRKMLDIALTQIKPNYASIMSQYIKVVDQRNVMLKKFGDRSFKMPYFEPWNEQLIKLGSKIIKYRLQFVEKLSKNAAEIYSGISSDKEKFSLYYDFSKENLDEADIENKLREEIEKAKEKDAKYQYTNAGPHTHDLSLLLDGRETRAYGSQGQQRSCALSLKLAEAEIIGKAIGESPIVLLDDVMSELDEGRQNFILNFLTDRQVFITCCDPSQMMRSVKGKVFDIT